MKILNTSPWNWHCFPTFLLFAIIIIFSPKWTLLFFMCKNHKYLTLDGHFNGQCIPSGGSSVCTEENTMCDTTTGRCVCDNGTSDFEDKCYKRISLFSQFFQSLKLSLFFNFIFIVIWKTERFLSLPNVYFEDLIFSEVLATKYTVGCKVFISHYTVTLKDS